MQKGKAFNIEASGLDITQQSLTLALNLLQARVIIITLQSNIDTFTVSNVKKGEEYDFIFIQDATGGRTVVAPTEINFLNNIDANPNTKTTFRGIAISTSEIIQTSNNTGTSGTGDIIEQGDSASAGSITTVIDQGDST